MNRSGTKSASARRSLSHVVLVAFPLVYEETGILRVTLRIEFRLAQHRVEAAAGQCLLHIGVLQATRLLQRLGIDLNGRVAEQNVAVRLDLVVAEALNDLRRCGVLARIGVEGEQQAI